MPRILIRDQRQRWGSCAPDGTLRFNWRAMMLPPALTEYVVVHGLSHLAVKEPLGGLLGVGVEGDARRLNTVAAFFVRRAKHFPCDCPRIPPFGLTQ